MVNGNSSQSGLLGTPEDNKLGSNLSRSRSAQAATTKLTIPSNYKEGPRSALPSQSFNVPAPLRSATRNWEGDGDNGDGHW